MDYESFKTALLKEIRAKHGDLDLHLAMKIVNACWRRAQPKTPTAPKKTQARVTPTGLTGVRRALFAEL